MFMGVGVAFAWGASNYTIGNGARMGPGYFPLALGVLLAVLGGIITFKALVVETFDGDKVGAFAWKPLVFIILANLVFGAMIGGLPKFGIPAMGLIVLATILAVMSYLAFIVLLKLQFPVWPAFISA
jgi:hypothetical protein